MRLAHREKIGLVDEFKADKNVIWKEAFEEWLIIEKGWSEYDADRRAGAMLQEYNRTEGTLDVLERIGSGRLAFWNVLDHAESVRAQHQANAENIGRWLRQLQRSAIKAAERNPESKREMDRLMMRWEMAMEFVNAA